MGEDFSVLSHFSDVASISFTVVIPLSLQVRAVDSPGVTTRSRIACRSQHQIQFQRIAADYLYYNNSVSSGETNQQTQNFCITFVPCWPSVFDVGPTLYECYTNVLCLLGYVHVKPAIGHLSHTRVV